MKKQNQQVWYDKFSTKGYTKKKIGNDQIKLADNYCYIRSFVSQGDVRYIPIWIPLSRANDFVGFFLEKKKDMHNQGI